MMMIHLEGFGTKSNTPTALKLYTSHIDCVVYR